MEEILISGLVTIVTASCPLIFAGVGEVVTERSGVLNLGVEGMMAMGAVGGFAVAHISGSADLGLLASIVCGMLLSLLFGFFTQYLLINQVVSGLSLTIFGLGLSALIGREFVGFSGLGFPSLFPEFLRDIPVLGRVLFDYNYVVYLSLLSPFLVSWFLFKTRAGIVVRATGDNAEAAHSLGIRVVKVRMLSIMFGGGMAGLGGGYLSVIYTPLWVENMVAGRGWVALALVVFAAWRPILVLWGALLFGGIAIIQLNVQAFGLGIQAQYMTMFPYLATVLVLVVMSKRSIFQKSPRSLGRLFFAD
jgi:simple sugar transport system permease protein